MIALGALGGLEVFEVFEVIAGLDVFLGPATVPPPPLNGSLPAITRSSIPAGIVRLLLIIDVLTFRLFLKYGSKLRGRTFELVIPTPRMAASW